MKAPAIKVEGELLERIERHRPPEQPVTAFVRAVRERELRRREMSQAADAYALFLADNEDERRWLESWDSADLATAPRRKKR